MPNQVLHISNVDLREKTAHRNFVQLSVLNACTNQDTVLCGCVLLYKYSISVAVLLLITEILLRLYFT